MFIFLFVSYTKTNEKCGNYVLFPLLVLCTKVHSHLTFFVKTFLRIRNQHQILRFLISILKIFEEKKYFLGHISTFCKFLSRTSTKQLKKSKNVFYKCVLELALYPSIFVKSQNRCSLICILKLDLVSKHYRRQKGRPMS
jgi:hypothetical protein